MFDIPNDPKELAKWLVDRGFSRNIGGVLIDNQVGGQTFLKLTRSDLQDIFPDSFLIRKSLWDFLEDMRQQEQEGCQEDFPESLISSDDGVEDKSLSSGKNLSLNYSSSKANGSITTGSSISQRKRKKGPSSTSTLSVASDTSECKSNESDLLRSMDDEPVPKLKRSNASYDRKIDPVNDEGEFNKKYVFPIPKEVKTANAANEQLPEKVRNRFLRECLTCLQAIAAEDTGNVQPIEFEMAAKKICKSLPIFKDIKPPGWPLKKEFPFWSTVKYQLRQRYHNSNYQQRKSEGIPAKKQHNIVEYEHDDSELHHKEMIKELKRKQVNYEAIRELQKLSFESRRSSIEDLKGKDVANQVLEMYPFFKNEIVLLNELELHVGRLVKTQADIDLFEKNFKKIQPLVKAASDDIEEDQDIHAGETLDSIQKIAKIKQPFVLFIPEDVVDLEDFIKHANVSTAPALAALETENDTQLSIIIDKELKIVLNTKDYIIGLLILLASFYVFNIAYDQEKATCFKFLEKHILGINPKKTTAALRALENKIFSK